MDSHNPKIKLYVFALNFVLLFVCSNGPAFAKKRIPRFKDYPVANIYKGKPAPLKLTREEKKAFTEKNYSTRLRITARLISPDVTS